MKPLSALPPRHNFTHHHLLGAVSVAAALWLPKGLWGLIAERTGFRFFPIGFHVDGIIPRRPIKET